VQTLLEPTLFSNSRLPLGYSYFARRAYFPVNALFQRGEIFLIDYISSFFGVWWLLPCGPFLLFTCTPSFSSWGSEFFLAATPGSPPAGHPFSLIEEVRTVVADVFFSFTKPFHSDPPPGNTPCSFPLRDFPFQKIAPSFSRRPLVPSLSSPHAFDPQKADPGGKGLFQFLFSQGMPCPDVCFPASSVFQFFGGHTSRNSGLPPLRSKAQHTCLPLFLPPFLGRVFPPQHE